MSLTRVQHVTAKRSRRGGVTVLAREHYLREDVHTGLDDPLDAAQPVLVLDGELLLYHLNWAMQAARNAVVLQSGLAWLESDTRTQHVAREAREWIRVHAAERALHTLHNVHLAPTHTVRSAGETAAQHQRRAALAAVVWLRARWPATVSVTLLSWGPQWGEAVPLQQWCARPECPPLMRLMVGWHEEEEEEEEENRPALYPAHMSLSDAELGVARGLLREGRFYADELDDSAATVLLHGGAGSVSVTQHNRALSGDRVVIDGDARVVAVTRRVARTLVGSVDCATALFRAVGQPGTPPIQLRDAPRALLEGRRVAVCVDCWPRHRVHPLGHIVAVLGSMDDPHAEQEATLLSMGVRTHEWSAAQLSELPPADFVPPLGRREDLRHLPICSVDPPGCTDIDDALHCVALPDGRWEVGVHIADVGEYVTEGSELDREARERSTTVYLVDRRVEMLPSLLSSNLCSLMGNVDRHAMSVIWTLDADGLVIDSRFCKSLIRSRASLTYAAAQRIIDSGAGADAETVASLRGLHRLSQRLRARRFAMGALELSSPTVTFVHRDNGGQDVLDVHMYTSLEANSMVEEWMLLANVCVAAHIVQHYPAQAMLRRHPRPDPTRWAQLVHALAQVGVEGLGDSDSANVARALASAPVAARVLVTRYMQQAVYVCSSSVAEAEYWHYGLACPIYTHFTSPIRRYADLCVHRLLAASIGWTAAPPQMDARQTERTARHINHRHRMAQAAGRASAELHSRRVLLQGGARTLKASVLAVVGRVVRVVVPELGVEVRVELAPDVVRVPRLLDDVMVRVAAVKGRDGFEAELMSSTR